MKFILAFVISLFSSTSYLRAMPLAFNAPSNSTGKVIIRGEKAFFPGLKTMEFIAPDQNGNPKLDPSILEYRQDGYLQLFKTQGTKSTWDDEGNQKTKFYNVFNRWQYNRNGRPKHSFNIWIEKETSIPDIQQFIAYKYDSNEQLTGIEENGIAEAEITYDPIGRVDQVKVATSTTIFDYDKNTVTTIDSMTPGEDKIDVVVTYESLEKIVRAQDVSSIAYDACSYDMGPILRSSCGQGEKNYSCTLSSDGNHLDCQGYFVADHEEFEGTQIFTGMNLGGSFMWFLTHEERNYIRSERKAKYKLETKIDTDGLLTAQTIIGTKVDGLLFKEMNTTFEWDHSLRRLKKHRTVGKSTQDELDSYIHETSYKYWDE